MSKYEKTKYPNIFCYETKKGKRFRIRRAFYKDGKKTELDESGFRTLAEAKVRLAEIERVLAMNESDYLTQKQLTCDEYYQKYSLRKLQVKQWSKATKIKHDADWRNHISPVFGNIPMSKLKLETYTLWIAEKLKKYRKSTVISYHHTFMNMLNDAVDMGIIERNRLRRVVIGDSNLEPKSKRFSFEDYQIWMAAAEKHLTPYDFTFVYLCSFGLRRGEILGLKPSIIYFV
ncbi:site-specific integrase [Enterococcus cecorum]|nr:site-specific integrase [Enterococcus cecorum]